MEQTTQIRKASLGHKALSLLLALVLAIGLCPMPKQAFADDLAVSVTPTTVAASDGGTVKLTATASGGIEASGYTFAWKYVMSGGYEGSFNSYITGISISSEGATSTLEFTSSKTQYDGAKVYCVVTNGSDGTATSSQVPISFETATDTPTVTVVTDPADADVLVTLSNPEDSSDYSGASGVYSIEEGSWVQVSASTYGTDYTLKEVKVTKKSDGSSVTVQNHYGEENCFQVPDDDVTVAVVLNNPNAKADRTVTVMTDPADADVSVTLSNPEDSSDYSGASGVYSIEEGSWVQVSASTYGTDYTLKEVKVTKKSDGSSVTVQNHYGEENCFQVPDDDVTVAVELDGGSSETTYDITGVAGNDNVSRVFAKINSTEVGRAAAGETVSIWWSQSNGNTYGQDDRVVVVTDKDGNDISESVKLTMVSNGVGGYIFEMPNEDVWISVTLNDHLFKVIVDDEIKNGSITVDGAGTFTGTEEATIELTVEGVEDYYRIDEDGIVLKYGNAWGDDVYDYCAEVSEVEDGKATITIYDEYAEAEAEDLFVTACFKDARAKQTITAGDLTVRYGDAATPLGATASGTLTYQSSDEAVATVDASGNVTPVGVGEATITISAADTDAYQSATKTITVKVEEAENGLVASAVAVVPSVAYSAADQVIAAEKLYVVSSANGDVVYVKKSGSSELKVNPASGEITVPSSTVPGTYSANVIVFAGGDATHAAKYAIVPVSVTVTKASIEGKAATLSNGSFTYNGKAQAPAVKRVGGFTFSAGDFDVTYSNAASTNAGNYTVTVAAKADSLLFSGTAKVATYKINKAANPFATKNVSKTFTLANVKKGKGTIAFADYRKSASTAAQGKMTNKVGKQVNAKTKKAVKYFSVDANGKVTAAKNTPKGTYQVTLSMKAAGNANYNASKELKPVLTVTVK